MSTKEISRSLSNDFFSQVRSTWLLLWISLELSSRKGHGLTQRCRVQAASFLNTYVTRDHSDTPVTRLSPPEDLKSRFAEVSRH